MLMTKRREIDAEARRIVDLLARDSAEAERAGRVRQGHSNERPAKRDWYVALNSHDPDAKRRYVSAPGPDHPLTRARHKGKLDAHQFEAANVYRLLCVAAFQQAGGRDSTQAMTIDGGKANYESMVDLSMGDAEALVELTRIHRQLGSVSASILLFVCFKGMEIGEAVKLATEDVAHPDGRIGHFIVAINQLSRAIRKLPPKEIIHPYQKSA